MAAASPFWPRTCDRSCMTVMVVTHKHSCFAVASKLAKPIPARTQATSLLYINISSTINEAGAVIRALNRII